ncbi:MULTISPECIES: cell wall hydrolase [unclassified Sphingomonas]|uniref:cell wall hydrolase n=1 Tax=unclassified Sphingomonas TaxID=196159 RepID=UPI00226985DE|nr:MULTISPECIES: cell wall hydrolase [unclassified Sphingomonas]
MMRVWLMLAGTGLLLLALLSAQAACRAVIEHQGSRSSTAASDETTANPTGGTPIGNAQPVAETAAPAAGVTGTIALPTLPAGAEAAAATGMGDSGVVPAAPFSMRSASYVDQARALECLTAAIYYEAASEPDAGQSAVAQVILNRVRLPAFPATVCGVVYQGSEHAGCQFSFACDGALARIPARAAWLRAGRAAGMALAGYVYAPVGLATHYHTYAVTPAWNRSMVMTDVVGAHFFHRWKGYWGTAAAFRQVYRGGEPMPGPHLPTAPTATIIAATAPLAAMPLADAKSMAAAPVPVAADDHLPPAAQVLDRWKDSGKPLF